MTPRIPGSRGRGGIPVWNERTVIEVIDLFNHGWTATDIANQYNQTRNAVCGLLNRRGVARHREPTSKTGGTMNRAEAAGTRKVTRKAAKGHARAVRIAQRLLNPLTETIAMPQVDDPVRPLHARSYADLEDQMCHWPLYEEQGVQMYCAADIDPEGPRGRPYCAAHGHQSGKRSEGPQVHKPWVKPGRLRAG